MELRTYQQSSLDGTLGWLKTKITHPLIVLPTGSGKTIVFAHLIKTLYKQDPSQRFLIIAHRQELISQAKEKILNVWPNAPCGILSANLKQFNNTASIIIASRDTLASQTRLYKSLPVDYIIIDEAHHVSLDHNSRYRKIINHFEEIGSPKVIGVTATPYRMGQGYIYGTKADFFGGVSHSVSIPELIKQQYLCRLSAFAVAKEAIIDASKARLKFKGGDYRESDLEILAMVDSTIRAIIDDWLEKAFYKGRTSTVFFCVSILHAQKMCMALRSTGIKARFITGETPTSEREIILNQFENGEINALCNVAVLTEGWDAPRTDCIALLRPTKSLGLYVQICGRGMRTWGDKTDCLLLDYGGNMQRHGCIDIAKPSRLSPTDDEEDMTWICDECFAVNDYTYDQCIECNALKPQPTLELDLPGDGQEEKEAAETTEAATGYVLSDEVPDSEQPIYRTEQVASVTAKKKTSKKGNEYLSVEFNCKGVYWPQSTALMIGMYGKAGDIAREKWDSMAKERRWGQMGKVPPRNIDDAVDLINNEGIFSNIKEVNLKKEGKYWNVIGVNF